MTRAPGNGRRPAAHGSDAPPGPATSQARLAAGGEGSTLPRGSLVLQEIPLDRVRPSPHQPRQAFDPAELDELAASIRQHGLLQPIKVTCHEDGGETTYQLIFGERRWRAAAQAGLKSIPAIVVAPDEVDDADRAVQGLVENLHRADLSPLETLAGLKALMALTGLSWSQLASLVGKSRRTLYHYRSLDRMSEGVQARVAAGQLTMKHVNALGAVEDTDTQEQLVEAVVEGGLSGAALEEIVQSVKAGDAVQSAVIRAASRRLPPPPRPGPAADHAGEAPTETRAPETETASQADGRSRWAVTGLHEAAMAGLTDQQRADLAFEIRERELDVPDTRHAAAVMRRDPAKSAGAAVTYAQVLRGHRLHELFKSLDFVLGAIAPLACADQPRAVRTVALAFLAEKDAQLSAVIDTLRAAESQARPAASSTIMSSE